MRSKLTSALLGAVIVATVTVLATGTLSANPFGVGEMGSNTETALVIGHVTLTAYDTSGNIKAYQQTDNLVVNEGENCATEILFDNNPTTSTICGTTSVFQAIAIGTGTGGAVDGDTALGIETSRGGYDSAVFTAASGATAAQAVVERDFTGIAATITESGVFNDNSTGGSLFARQTFTGIPLTASDTLNVSWTVDIGGA